MPLPGFSVALFPDRVDLLRRRKGARNASGMSVDQSAADVLATAIPCSIEEAGVGNCPDLMALGQNRVDLVVTFRADAPVQPDDLLRVAAGDRLRVGGTLLVWRYRAQGLLGLRLWRADCKALA